MRTGFAAQSSANVRPVVGPRPTLLSTFTDPTSFVGWGYPSVLRNPRAAPGAADAFLMVYQGWWLGGPPHSTTKLALLAQSADAVHWAPSGLAPGSARARNELFPMGGVELCPAFDDGEQPPGGVLPARFKGLLSNRSIVESDDAVHWRDSGRLWLHATMDPGFGVFRSWNGSLVVATSRPKALRAQGRHAGLHAAGSWPDLAAHPTQRDLPVDELYADADQIYGMPAFRFGSGLSNEVYAAHLWRYNVSSGHMRAGVAFSTTAANFTSLGQRVGNNDDPPPSPMPVLFGNEPGTPFSYQVYPNTLLTTNDSILVHASAATVPHGTVAANASSLLTFRLRLDGLCALAVDRAAAGPGLLQTVPLAWAGGDLAVNVLVNRTGSGSGSLRVQVGDASGAPLPGYAFADHQPFTGDALYYQPRWGSGAGRSIASLGRTTLTLAFRLDNALLFAFRGNFSRVAGFTT